MLSPETRQSTKRRSEAASLSELLTPNKAFANRPSKRASKRRTPAKGRLASHPRRILVVDDVPDVTEMIALFLKHAGFDVTTANSADSALHLSSENQFDLIISDIGMPEMNGYDLVESLRTREAYQHTPMIAVTGYTEYDDRGRSLRSGFNAHLTKPINPSDLLSVIGELLA
ncbi:MAG TPA: response regulator [Pyrinomonadaceae bacterium]|nr:response regulator [Pyrinomonadaceae bacterium]